MPSAYLNHKNFLGPSKADLVTFLLKHVSNLHAFKKKQLVLFLSSKCRLRACSRNFHGYPVTNRNIPFTASLSQTDFINMAEYPLPYPSKFKDAWDDVSVKMPCSEKNLFPVETEVCDSILTSLCTSLRNTTEKVFLPLVAVEANCPLILFYRMEVASKVGGI